MSTPGAAKLTIARYGWTRSRLRAPGSCWMRSSAKIPRGNPFFLEESVRTLAETGVIVGEGGSYRLGKPMVAIQVPSTVQAVLAARIDRLSVRDKRLLQSAAVIGKDVPFVLL